MKKRKRPLKVNSRTFSDRDHSNSLALPNASNSWSNLSRNWLPQNKSTFRKRKKNRNRLFKSSIKRKTRHSHVAVGVLWRQKMNKKVLNNKCRVVVSPIQPFAFTTFSLPLPLPSWHHTAFLHGGEGGGGLRETQGTWGNPLRWGNLPENIISHFNFITFTW